MSFYTAAPKGEIVAEIEKAILGTEVRERVLRQVLGHALAWKKADGGYKALDKRFVEDVRGRTAVYCAIDKKDWHSDFTIHMPREAGQPMDYVRVYFPDHVAWGMDHVVSEIGKYIEGYAESLAKLRADLARVDKTLVEYKALVGRFEALEGDLEALYAYRGKLPLFDRR